MKTYYIACPVCKVVFRSYRGKPLREVPRHSQRHWAPHTHAAMRLAEKQCYGSRKPGVAEEAEHAKAD